jgi:hypothetical protein
MPSPNLAVTHVAAAQNQKEVTINDAIDALDRALTETLALDCSAGGVIAVGAGQMRRNLRLVLEGAPSAAFTVELAAVRRPVLIRNASGRSATLRNPGGQAVVELAPDRHLLVYSTGANLWAVGSPDPSPRAYDFGMLETGSPAPGAVMGKVVIPRAVAIPAQFAGSAGHVDVPPQGSPWEISITRNSAQPGTAAIGTVRIDTAGALAFATAGGSPVALSAGDVIRFIADAEGDPAEAGVAGIALTIAAELV